MIRTDHHLREDQIAFLEERKYIDRAEHIRRALDLYIEKIKEEEGLSFDVAISASQKKKGVTSGTNYNQPSTTQEP